mgnify:CR=1 FL=1
MIQRSRPRTCPQNALGVKMENALLIGLTRQITLKREMAIVANNLANANTTGFKAEQPLFEEYLMPVARDDSPNKRLSFVLDQGIHRNLADGGLKTTDNPMDFAISGDGFFKVQTPEGIRYTRNGHFQLDATGRLVTDNGDPLLAEGDAPVFFSPEETSIEVASDGTISTELGERGKLTVVAFDNPRDMKKTGNNMLETDQPEIEAQNTRIIQGALESSNVNSIEEMTRMIDVLRSYTSAAKLVEQADEMKRRAIQELGGRNN